MNDREKVIADLTRKIKEAEGSQRRLLGELGAFLLDRGIGSTPGYEEPAGRAAETEIALEQSMATQSEIKRILERKGAIRYRLKEVDSELQSLEKENAESYQVIGEAVYQAYNSGLIPGDAYSPLFGEIVRQIVDLRKTEREIEESRRSMGDKMLFERIIDQGRLAILSGNKAMKERNLEREYWKAGKELCASDLLDSIEYQPVRDLAARCLENRHKTRDGEELKASLVSEDESLSSALAELDADRLPQKRLQELEKIVHNLQESQREALIRIGEKYESEKPVETGTDPVVRRILSDLEAERRNVKNYETEIERNRAVIRAEVLTAQIGEMEKKVSQIEQQIEKARRDIEVLRAEIDVREGEKARMEQIASGKIIGTVS